MTTLMSFILDTLRPQVNDATNAKLWLPGLLVNLKNDQGQSVLPIHADKQDLGQLTGDNGSYIAQQFATDWGIFYEGDAIPNPAAPLPILNLSEVVLDGLQNITVEPATAAITADGYQVTVPLSFNKYMGAPADVAIPPLTVSGTYDLTQSLQVKATPPIQSLSGTGSFVAQFPDLVMTAYATVAVKGSGANRTVSLDLSKLEISGAKDPTPSVVFSKLTLDSDLPAKDALVDLIRQALENSQGAGAMAQAMSVMLNAPSNLDSINSMLGGKGSDVVSSIFGPLPSGGLPAADSGQTAATPLDLMLFDRMRVALCQCDSNWYVPWQLAGSSDPVLEPYSNATIAIPDQKIGGLLYSGITLTDVLVHNASNAVTPVPSSILTTPRIDATLVFGTLSEGPVRDVPRQGGAVPMHIPPTPPLTASANFTLTQNGLKKVTLNGTVNATITGLGIAIEVVPSGTSVDDLTLTIQNFAADVSAVQVAVQVQLAPRDPSLEGILQTMFGRKDVQSGIASSLNKELAGQKDALSKEFSQIARTAINNQLRD